MSGEGNCRADEVAGFDKGRWPVRFLANRAGFSPAPVSPIWAIARVPLSNRDTAAETFPVGSGPRVSALRASRPALPRPERERQRERRPGRRGGGASGPAGRLETVQKVFTRGVLPVLPVLAALASLG
jgi:hypothetical protein